VPYPPLRGTIGGDPLPPTASTHIKESIMPIASKACAWAALLLPLLAHAGVVIETVEVDTRTGKAMPGERIFLQGGLARMESGDGDVSILKGDSIYSVDKAERSYSVFDQATAQKLGAQLAKMREQMQAGMAKMPPAQRAQMEKSMGAAAGRKPPTFEAVDTGRSDTVDGRSCRVWNLETDGVVDAEYCVVPYTSLPGKEDVQGLLRRMAGLMSALTQNITGKDKDGGNGYLRAYLSVNGYPVRERDIVNGKPDSSETRLKSWQEQAIPAALFEVPAGYKRVDPAAQLGDDDDG
jgi:hypothetical protein